MQEIAYSRYFDFQKNTLISHSHNLAAISRWFNETDDLSHNQCLTLLAYAYGYKSYAALNSSLKAHEPLEPLQSAETYVARLEKGDYSNFSCIDSKYYCQIASDLFTAIATYIVECQLDLNHLDQPSPLKDIYLSSERTVVSTFYLNTARFLDHAILNTVLAATYDHGLPSEIRIDKRIVELFSGPDSYFYSLKNRHSTGLDLFNSALMKEDGTGHYIVQFSKDTHNCLKYLTQADDCSTFFNKTTGVEESLYISNAYPKQLTNLKSNYYQPPKALLKKNSDCLRIFTVPKEPIRFVTVHNNSFRLNNNQISDMIKDHILNIPVHKLTDIELDLQLSDERIKLYKLQHIQLDKDAKRIRRRYDDFQITLYFSHTIDLDGVSYLAEIELCVLVFIDYIIDCNDKPSINIQSVQLTDNSDINTAVDLYKLTKGDVENSDEMLRLSVNFKPPKVLPYTDIFKNMLNQTLNCHAFEIGCIFHVIKKFIESQSTEMH